MAYTIEVSEAAAYAIWDGLDKRRVEIEEKIERGYGAVSGSGLSILESERGQIRAAMRSLVSAGWIDRR